MLTVKAAADRMGVSPGIVYALCSSHTIRHSRVGLGRGKIVISEEAVAEYLRSREVGPAPKEQVMERKPKVMQLEHLTIPG